MTTTKVPHSNGSNLNTLKNILIVLSICIITVAFSWLSIFNLLGVFIDIAPYSVGGFFYISEIALTFSLYFLGSHFAIKHTSCHPALASLPVGITGLILYYIELGGLDCVGVCGMPFWYDLISFFKHIAASVLASILSLIKPRSNTERIRDNANFESSGWFSNLLSIKSIVTIFSLLVVSILIWGHFLFSGIAENMKTVSLYSEVLNEQRKVAVFLPSGYFDTDEHYDVLYTLDGENLQQN